VLPGFLDQPPATITAWLAERRQPPMRAKQILRWIISSRAVSFEEMTNIPRDLRQELATAFSPLSTRIAHQSQSRDGTLKLLLRLADGGTVESVLIPEGDRRTACISTQVGCAMGCVFCASGLEGVERNLTSGEILEQLIQVRNLLPTDERLTNVVVMGMGEPLANIENLVAALEVAGDKNGLEIGARHVTISTVGIPAKIRRLADLQKQYHLAVSLHAPNDALRTRIVPTNDAIGIAAILDAADYFFMKTGRQVTYEYVVLGGLNDLPDHAGELARFLRGRKAYVNLIPFNEVEGLAYRRPTDQSLATFTAILQRAGIRVKIRKRKGADIDAACGQLRRRNSTPPEPAPVASVE
jgi:23S rRNA (adenine2503-C2)-methyltransferase